MRRLVIAIDGPAGAGKSSAAKALAQTLGYTLLDTGAIYRALAFLARERGVAWSDGAALADLARGLDVGFRLDGEQNRILVSGRDLTSEVRRPDMGEGASQVSAHPEVRRALLDLQRQLARGGGVVAEGRDTTTVVFPHADLKFFLTAEPETRARRRFAEDEAGGHIPDYATTLSELKRRDERDTTRAVAPLKQAEDAIVIDSTDLSLVDVVRRMLEAVAEAGKDVDKAGRSD